MVAYTDPSVSSLVRLFLEGILTLILNGKRALEDVRDVLQVCKEHPSQWALVVGAVRGTYSIVEVENPTATFKLNTRNPRKPEYLASTTCRVEKHQGLGIVVLRFVGGELFINDRRVGEHLYQERLVDFGTQLAGKQTLPDNILELLVKKQDNPAVRAFLKKYEDRSPVFLATTYTVGLGWTKAARRLEKREGRFCCSHTWLGFDQPEREPILVIESPLVTGT